MLEFEKGQLHEPLGKAKGTELKTSVCSFFLKVLAYLQRPFAYRVCVFDDVIFLLFPRWDRLGQVINPETRAIRQGRF